MIAVTLSPTFNSVFASSTRSSLISLARKYALTSSVKRMTARFASTFSTVPVTIVPFGFASQ
jgi:hypothetical protein